MLLEVIVFAFFSISCVWLDFKTKKIPLGVGYGFLLSGIALSFFNGFLASNAVGIVFALAFGFVLWKAGAWGAGDARLLAGIQAWSFFVGGGVFFFVFVFLASAFLLLTWLVLAESGFDLKNVFAARKTRSYALFLLVGFLAVCLLILARIKVV